MAMRLIDSLAGTEAMSRIFSDEALLQAMLDFEVALAQAEGDLGIIPASAADAITRAAIVSKFDIEALVTDTFRAGTAGIPVVKALTEQVRKLDPLSAGYVHWGATSQDVVDTALVLLLQQAQKILEADADRLDQALRKLSRDHSGSVMLGRTLMQAAPPVTFGLKAAGWLAATRRCRTRLQVAFSEALILQFGGAVGTLAALGDRGIDVSVELAKKLGLGCPDAPWPTQRDRLAALICELGILTVTLGKMARDISLLMQNEIGEVAEARVAGRGGSSTMPHKRNPTGCALTLAAANRAPGLVANFLSGMVQENERGVGGWQAEGSTVCSIVMSSATALSSMAEVAGGLTIDVQRMEKNLADTRGVIFAERAMILLGKALGRDTAHRILEEAAEQSLKQNKSLSEMLAGMPEVTAHIGSATLRSLDDPREYLGVAEIFRQRLIADAPVAYQTERK